MNLKFDIPTASFAAFSTSSAKAFKSGLVIVTPSGIVTPLAGVAGVEPQVQGLVFPPEAQVQALVEAPVQPLDDAQVQAALVAAPVHALVEAQVQALALSPEVVEAQVQGLVETVL